jgi:hypothetical protein
VKNLLIVASLLLFKFGVFVSNAGAQSESAKSSVKSAIKELKNKMVAVDKFYAKYKLQEGQTVSFTEVYYQSALQLQYTNALLKGKKLIVKAKFVVNNKDIELTTGGKTSVFDIGPIWQAFQRSLGHLKKLPKGRDTRVSHAVGFWFMFTFDQQLRSFSVLQQYEYRVMNSPVFGLPVDQIKGRRWAVKEQSGSFIFSHRFSRTHSEVYRVSRSTGILQEGFIEGNGKKLVTVSLVKLDRQTPKASKRVFDISKAVDPDGSKKLEVILRRMPLKVGFELLFSRFFASRREASAKDALELKQEAGKIYEELLEIVMLDPLRRDFKEIIKSAWTEFSATVPAPVKRARRITEKLPAYTEQFLENYLRMYLIDENSSSTVFVQLFLKDARTEKQRKDLEQFYQELQDQRELVHVRIKEELSESSKEQIKALVGATSGK